MAPVEARITRKLGGFEEGTWTKSRRPPPVRSIDYGSIPMWSLTAPRIRCLPPRYRSVVCTGWHVGALASGYRSKLLRMASDVPFSEIQEEFDQTFGYVRQDIGAILNRELRLHYTITLLACCACEMLAWHNDVSEHAIFVALLPDTPHYKRIGKTLWEALSNGLAHNFRPDTIKIGTNHWRFSISSDSAPLITGTAGDPHWIRSTFGSSQGW